MSLILVGIAAVPAAVGLALLWGALRVGDRLVYFAERSDNESKT